MTPSDAFKATLIFEGRSDLRFVDGGKRDARWWRMPRRHVLMLVLAFEVLAFGVAHADRYHRPPVATVDPPSIPGHVIT